MPKIYLRAGHGGATSGATGNGLVEKQENLRHILALAASLSDYNAELKLARSTDTTVSLATSIGEANNWGADLYYSSHINGFSDPAAFGYESYIYTSPSAESIRVQDVMHARQGAVWVRWGSQDRGKKRANFAELRETFMAAILTENGFITNTHDAQLLKNNSFLSELTAATVRAFIELYGLKLTDEGVPDVKAQKYIVKPGDTISEISRMFDMTLSEIMKLNPHIADLNVIYAGDIVYLTQPSEFEVEYAAMNRELILCRNKLKEFQEIATQINTLSQKLI